MPKQLEMIVCDSVRGPGHKVLVPENLMYERRAGYAIVIHNDAVLMLKVRSSGRLWLPGGGIEESETVREATVRECREECGVEVVLHELVGTVKIQFAYDPPHIPDYFEAFFQTCYIYRGTVKDPTLLSDHEVDDLECEKPRWIPLDTLTTDMIQNFPERLLGMIEQCRAVTEAKGTKS